MAKEYEAIFVEKKAKIKERLNLKKAQEALKGRKLTHTQLLDELLKK